MPTGARGPLTVVTGAGRGIGEATALRLARDGHDLVLGYLHDQASIRRVIERARAIGVQAVAVGGDVSQASVVDRLFEAAAQLGSVTGVVNNAGATLHIGDLVDTPIEVIRRVIEINLIGALLVARRAAQELASARAQPDGAIVNVSSAAATLGSPHEYVHYAAAKAGVETMTLGLARELAQHGVRVNAVAPGVVDTAIHRAAGDPQRPDRVRSTIPLQRVAQADEIAAAIAWLLGPDASYTTGAVLRVAGGL